MMRTCMATIGYDVLLRPGTLRRCIMRSSRPVEPAADAHVRPQPSGQHRGEPRIGFPEFLGPGRGLGAFDDLAVVVADELDGAGRIPPGNGVDDIHPRLVQRSRDS